MAPTFVAFPRLPPVRLGLCVGLIDTHKSNSSIWRDVAFSVRTGVLWIAGSLSAFNSSLRPQLFVWDRLCSDELLTTF